MCCWFLSVSFTWNPLSGSHDGVLRLFCSRALNGHVMSTCMCVCVCALTSTLRFQVFSVSAVSDLSIVMDWRVLLLSRPSRSFSFRPCLVSSSFHNNVRCTFPNCAAKQKVIQQNNQQSLKLIEKKQTKQNEGLQVNELYASTFPTSTLIKTRWTNSWNNKHRQLFFRAKSV